MRLSKLIQWPVGFPRHRLWIIFVVLIAMTYVSSRYLTPELLDHYGPLVWGYVREHYAVALSAYFVVYVLLIALSLPFATFLSLGAGYLYGMGAGVALSIAAVTIGTLLGFAIVQSWYATKQGSLLRQKQANELTRRQHICFLLLLNMLMVVPTFALNLIALSYAFSWWTVAWIALVGGIPFVAFNVWLGTKLRLLGHSAIEGTGTTTYALIFIGVVSILLLWYLAKLLSVHLIASGRERDERK